VFFLKDNFVVGAQGFHVNSYDGHTLNESMRQVEQLGQLKAKEVFVDFGYRGHDHAGETEVHVGAPEARKKRSVIEPVIGHMKNNGRLGRNYLLRMEGDRMNAILCGAGHNI
jgi:transposase, IS5 family